MLLLTCSVLALSASLTPRPLAAPRNVAIVVFPGVELLDFAGPGEVFAATRTADGARAFHVYTVAASLEPFESQGFVHMRAEFTYDDSPKPDIVVVPGGAVPSSSASLQTFLRQRAEHTELMMSVCNGAMALAAAGLLDGREVTSHHSALEMLQLMVPTARVHSNRRFVDHGDLLTSAGVSAGIDGALQVVTRLVGPEQARATAEYMEYAWRPEEIALLHAQPGERVGSATTRALLQALRADGVEAGLAIYRAEQEAGREVPGEATLNRAGYAMRAGRPAEARSVLELTLALFPESANAHDSLAELCELAGETARAAELSKHALALLPADPSLSDAFRLRLTEACEARVARIEHGIGAGPFACPPCGMPCDARRHAADGHCPDCEMELVRVGPDPPAGDR